MKGKNPEQSKKRQEAKTIAPETMYVFTIAREKRKVKKRLIFIGKEGKGTTVEKLSHDMLQRKYTRLGRHDELGDEGLSSGGTKMILIFITAEEAEGSVVKKFFGQGEQVQETPDVNEGGMINLSNKLQAKSTPTPRAYRLYLGKETIKEGSAVGIILVSLDEKMHSHVIRLKFNASDHAIDCETLLAGQAASVSKGMKDLHVFMDSPKLIAQTEGKDMPATEQERKYKKEIMEATTPFHRFQITHLPKILNSKAEVLTGLATIKLEFLNQEVSIGIKTILSVEETSSGKKGKATSKAPGAKPNYNWETSERN
ncbi:reverse transcriptase domain-containing protein [Tanacetum coccineum]